MPLDWNRQPMPESRSVRRRKTMSQTVTDQRRCPTCGHCHPNGIRASWCDCKDCVLLWTRIAREHLAPDYRVRLEELERLAALNHVEGVE